MTERETEKIIELRNEVAALEAVSEKLTAVVRLAVDSESKMTGCAPRARDLYNSFVEIVKSRIEKERKRCDDMIAGKIGRERYEEYLRLERERRAYEKYANEIDEQLYFQLKWLPTVPDRLRKIADESRAALWTVIDVEIAGIDRKIKEL